ncbi:hypothetical protein [Micromonospora haikouensis]|uniref:hypothetical protein n=1 Tax=Micromonospora haikouensis TaxID=686309 RepID=UPI003D903327
MRDLRPQHGVPAAHRSDGRRQFLAAGVVGEQPACTGVEYVGETVVDLVDDDHKHR